MNRDPENYDCTRDPIYLLQAGVRRWTQIPDGIETDSESMWVQDDDIVPDWVRPHIEDGSVNETAEFWKAAEGAENDHGWPMVYVEWITESVFLTRQEAEDFAKRHEYRWEKWRVYCIPCDGELARILREYGEVDPVTKELTEAYCKLREWQASLPAVGDVLLRQQAGRICEEIDRMFDFIEEQKKRGGPPPTKHTINKWV